MFHRFKRGHCVETLLRTNITVLHFCSHSVSSTASLSFLFPAETDVLVPVLSQSTDVVVVNFVVVLKFPDDCLVTGPDYIYGNWQMYMWDFAGIECNCCRYWEGVRFGSYGWKTLMFLIQRAYNCDFVDLCLGRGLHHPFKEPLKHITWMPIEIHVLS